MPGLTNVYEACVFTFGIAQGGGAGKVLSSGSLKDILSGICGPVIQEDSQTIQIKIIVLLKLLRFMGMNMQCIFHSWPAGKEIKQSQIIKPLSIMGDKWVPIMVGSEQIVCQRWG